MSGEARGRKATFQNNDSVVEALVAIHTGKFKSRYLAIKLVEMGLVETSTHKQSGRGRPRIQYTLSEKGRQQIGLAADE